MDSNTHDAIADGEDLFRLEPDLMLMEVYRIASAGVAWKADDLEDATEFVAGYVNARKRRSQRAEESGQTYADLLLGRKRGPCKIA